MGEEGIYSSWLKGKAGVLLLLGFCALILCLRLSGKIASCFSVREDWLASKTMSLKSCCLRLIDCRLTLQFLIKYQNKFRSNRIFCLFEQFFSSFSENSEKSDSEFCQIHWPERKRNREEGRERDYPCTEFGNPVGPEKACLLAGG